MPTLFLHQSIKPAWRDFWWPCFSAAADPKDVARTGMREMSAWVLQAVVMILVQRSIGLN
jgi:hypothetical protein